MAKKISPKLIETSQVIYAVLSPGNGFLKELYGEAHFHDNLPRASGCFVTKEAAIAAHQRAIALTRQGVEEAEKSLDEAGTTPSVRSARMYFVNRKRERFLQAHGAIIVEISIRGVI